MIAGNWRSKRESEAVLAVQDRVLFSESSPVKPAKPESRDNFPFLGPCGHLFARRQLILVSRADIIKMDADNPGQKQL